MFFPVLAKCMDNGKVVYDDKDKILSAHGGGLFFKDNIYYFYGEYRMECPNGNTCDSNQKVMMYSTKDFKKWKSHGAVLNLVGDRNNWDIERPKIIYNESTKKYIMWFHLEKYRQYAFNSGYAGVAVSENIDGPYRLLNFQRPNRGVKALSNDTSGRYPKREEVADRLNTENFRNGHQVRDLTLFKDKDNVAYLIYNSEDNHELHIAQLNKTYTGFSGLYTRIFVGGWNEAPAVFTYHGKYYLITSGTTGYNPNPISYAVSDSMLGQWKKFNNPIVSLSKEDKDTSFHSQPTFVFTCKNNNYIYLGDRWDMTVKWKSLAKSTYVWLPLKISDNKISISWVDKINPSDYCKVIN